MRYRDALRSAGRARREDDVCGVPRANRCQAVGVDNGIGRVGRQIDCVQFDDRELLRQPRPILARRQDGDGHGGIEDVLDPFGRVIGIDGNVRTACFEDGVHADHQIDASPHAECDEGLRADAERNQVSSKTVDSLRELRIGHGGVLVDDGRSIRVRCNPRCERGRQPVTCIDPARGVVPGLDYSSSFFRAEQIDIADRRSGVRYEGLEHTDEPGQDRVDVRGIEQITDVFECEGDSILRHHEQGQGVVRVVVGAHCLDGHAVDGRSLLRQLSFVHRVRLEDGEGVEQIPHSDRSLDVDEPHVVVVEQVCLFTLNPYQVALHRVGGIESNPHRDGVDEQPDHRLHASKSSGTTGDRGTEHDIGATGDVCDQQPVCRLHQRVHGDPESSAERRERRGGIGIDESLGLGRARRDLAPDTRRCDERRLLDTGKRRSPRTEGHGRVLLVEPCQVRAVRAHPRHRHRRTPSGVQIQQFLHHQR